MDVFTEKNSSRANVRQHFFQRNDLLPNLVAAIIDQNINSGHRSPKRLPEVAILLVTNEDFDTIVFIAPAGFFDVDAINMAVLAKILPPHLQASTAENANLNNVNFAPDELAEVSMINVEIMLPFPDPTADSVGVEICSKWILAVGWSRKLS